MTINSVCKQYSFGYVIEKSATTSLFTYAEEQDRTKNLNENADPTCKFPGFVTFKKNRFRFLIKKKISGLLVSNNMQHN